MKADVQKATVHVDGPGLRDALDLDDFTAHIYHFDEAVDGNAVDEAPAGNLPLALVGDTTLAAESAPGFGNALSTMPDSYATGGTYTVTLTVTDDAGDTGTTTDSVTVTEPGGGSTMHVGDLDGVSVSEGRTWMAVVTIAVLDDLGSAGFASDIASMKHETQYTRLFRS